MFLLSRETLIKHGYLKNQIKINPMKNKNLIKTFYYFRAGDTLKLLSPKEEIIDLEKVGKTTIPPNGFGLIKSREYFTFDSSIMAIFGIPLDVVTILIGSVAVGIGIDYTIHFITRFKVEHAKGKTFGETG